jgi:FtsP/CotA-like multicopper oxidase with cupredoxin domain
MQGHREMNNNHHLARILLPAAVVVITLVPALASAPAPANPAGAPVSPVSNPCARPPAGSIVQNPPALFSHSGILTARFSYQTRTDADGRTLLCFMTPDGLENPTLYVFPGDQIVLTVTNNTPAAPVEMKINPPNCGASMMTESSVNLHYHGTNTSPTCHQDEVIQTVINSGQTFTYDLHIPPDEPPGLYWYHPHIHGLVEHALQGGGSGAIVVEGIQDIQPAVAGMRQQVLVVRDQNVRGNPMPGGNVPSWDVTVNNIPIAYPDEIPAIIQMRPGEKQFWRVSNSSADTVLDLQVLFDGEPQTVQIVDFDGVPAGSQDGTNTGKLVAARDVLIPTAGRAEFIVKAPPATVRDARLVTLAINTGPDGDNDPERTLATIEMSSKGLKCPPRVWSPRPAMTVRWRPPSAPPGSSASRSSRAQR